MKLIASILILESSSILYEGLAQVLQPAQHARKVKQIFSFQELESCLELHEDSVVLINPYSVQYNLKEFQQLRSKYLKVSLIAFCHWHVDPKIISQFDAVITVQDTPEMINHTVSQVIQSKKGDTISQNLLLSDREIEVLQLLALGFTNKQIADHLNISVHTVNTHRKNISQKTGIKSVSGLTIYAVINNYVTIDQITLAH